MAYIKFSLDTNALLFLAGLEGAPLQVLKNRVEASSSELSITHVQVDEAHEKELEDYQQKIKKALASLTRRGINVRLEATKITVAGVSRADFTRLGDEQISTLYNELRKEIDMCQKTKGKPQSLLNIACDAVIAVSSLDHDFFITTDRCLFDSWLKIINKHGRLRQQHKVPKIIYARRSPKRVAQCISEFLS